MNKTLHLVFHTHWDREWYWTFEQYRNRLIHVIDRIIKALDNKEINAFVLDGQTLPLEDFLEVAEKSQKKKILDYIKKGNIVIGPWYIAMDEFLVQGESIIRNLEIGQKTASLYGTNQKFGYLPDTFGHIGQMPQILSDFDITSTMMWRGIELKNSEFIWEGTDGTQLFSIFLSDGYYQPLMNQDDYVQAIGTYINKIEPLARTSHLLMTAGGDHLMPLDQPLNLRIDALKKAYPAWNFKVTNYLKYIDCVKKEIDLKHMLILKGELRDNTHIYILPNVLSTRSYLKLLNQKLEDEMTGFIEPMTAIAYLSNIEAPSNYIEHIWKMILQNQPHDSICGCSIDPVHQENEMRGQKAQQMIAALYNQILDKLEAKSLSYHQDKVRLIFEDDSKLMIFNPHPYPFSGYVQGTIWVNEAHQIKEGIGFKDHQGNQYQAVINKRSKDRLFASPLDDPPAFKQGESLDIVIEVNGLRPLAWTSMEMIPVPFDMPKDIEELSIKNDYLSISLNDDGTLNVIDLTTQKIYQGWHQFFSQLDNGDSYNYSKPDQDTITYATLTGLPMVSNYGLYQSLSYLLVLNQPASLMDNRNEASNEFVETLISVTLTLYHNQKIVHVKTKIDQKAKDQRLRVRFDMHSPIHKSYSDSVFEIVERDCNRVEIESATRLKEVPVVVDPSLSMIYLASQNRGINVCHRGLHEFQTPEYDGQTSLEITLIRSVSHLSRDDFKSRGGAAGPNLATPDAQCIRVHEFEYTFEPITRTKDFTSALKDANEFRKQPRISKGYLQNDHLSLLGLSNSTIMMSSLRKISQNLVEVRLWNPTHFLQSTSILSDRTIEQITETQINGRCLAELHQDITFTSAEIKTLQIKYKSSE